MATKRDLSTHLGREPSVEEWAARLQVGPDDIEQQISRSRAAQAQLINLHRGLVFHWSRRYLGCGLNISDLRQEASIELVRASANYRPELGVRFSTFASCYIRAALSRLAASRPDDVVPLTGAAPAQLMTLERCAAAVAPVLGRRPTDIELATATGIRLARVAQLRRYMSGGGRTVLMDAQAWRCDDSVAAEVSTTNPAEDTLAEVEATRAWLREALQLLSPRQKAVLQLRYGLAQDGVPRQLKEVAAELGVSNERVRQIEIAAILKLKLAQEQNQQQRTLAAAANAATVADAVAAGVTAAAVAVGINAAAAAKEAAASLAEQQQQQIEGTAPIKPQRRHAGAA